MSAGLALGFVADVALGDPKKCHPVAGFGQIALALEPHVYAPRRSHGVAFTGSLVCGATMLTGWLDRRLRTHAIGRIGLMTAVTWAALGGRSLGLAARRIASAVAKNDLGEARVLLPTLVGRDVERATAGDACRATVESVAENTADAVVGPLFWGAIIGPAGVVMYRTANTLDAMVGHRNPRYESFGWSAARLDDILGWPGARISAWLAALHAPIVGGSTRGAIQAIVRDGSKHPSPNAGRVEAAFAGALDLTLGGESSYDGRVEQRGRLGHGRDPQAEDVFQAVRLAQMVAASSLGLCLIISNLRSRAARR